MTATDWASTLARNLDPASEITLTRERLHFGVFILPGIGLFIPPAFGLFFGLFYLRMMRSFAQMVGQPTQQPDVFPFFLFLVFFSCLPGIFGLSLAWVSYLKSEIKLTNRRLVLQTGAVFRVTSEISLENVEIISLVEPLLGRVFNFGTIVVTTVGGSNFPLRYVGAPKQFHSFLQQAVADAKAPRRSLAAKPQAPPPDDARYMPKG